MRKLPATLELMRGTAMLGTIAVRQGPADPPWHSGVFTPSPRYEDVRELFEQELALIRANTEDDAEQWEEWELLHEELNEPRLRLVSPDRSYEAEEILIHIDGEEAWWRDE